MKTIRWKPLLLILSTLPLLAACHKRGGLQIDDPIPVVSLQDFHGKTLTLPQDMKDRVLLVRFWSMECGFCDKDVLPGLEQLYRKYRDRGFVPVAINVGKVDPGDERWKGFEHLTYPMLTDERGLAAKKFGVIGLPTSFVIDRAGVLKEKITGEAGLDEFEKLFTTVLK